MTSNAPRACCTTGIKHEGTPKGSIKKIESVPIYFSQPEKANGKALVIFSDVFGLSSNIKLMADDFAAQGYLTIVPDILHGDWLDFGDFSAGKIDVMEYIGRHGPETIDSTIDMVVNYMRQNHKIEKLGAIGYCFGAKYAVRHLKDTVFDAAFVAHPSLITHEELSAITKPLSIAAAEIDPIFPADQRHKSEEILASMQVPYQMNLYGAVSHGWALRGDLNDPKVKFATDRAYEQAVTWFNYWL